jgi:TPR repeat protein
MSIELLAWRTARLNSLLALWLMAAAPGLAQDRRVTPSAADATGRRFALAIGNGAYSRSPLVNPVNDAADIGALLRDQFGFDVTVVTDASLQTMDRAIDNYLGRLSPGDVALFYYSGHGMQVGGENYLLPVDFAAADELDVKYKAYSASRVGERLRSRGVRLSILILDACRDNPYRSWRSESNHGLVGMGGEGAFIAFAAAEGKTADDNPRERNGLFTKHLLTSLRMRGLTIDEVFNRAREGVYEESKGRQVPFTYSGVVGVFRFQAAPDAAPAPPAPPIALDLDMERYSAVKDSRDPEQLEAFANKIGRADLAEILRARARALRSLNAAPPNPVIGSPKPLPQDGQDLAKRANAAFFRGDYSTATPLYQQLAEKGDSGAMRQLGYLYEKGLGVVGSEVQARRWLRRARSLGEDFMGRFFGSGVAQDDDQLIAWYRQAAGNGDRQAMFNLGWQYDAGLGVEKDYAQAMEWYRKAAERGDALAMINLGSMYSDARGVKQDYAQAVVWYRKAADLGSPSGMYSLGWTYENGRGMKQDYAQAMVWYRKAADLGEPLGMVGLGQMYSNGHEVPQDYAQAIVWYRKAADAGEANGMSALCVMYSNGLGVVRDEAQAIAWATKAAENGDSYGMYLLGFGYENGRGLTLDYAQAVAWYRKSADLGQPAGMSSLGDMYASGHGLKKDDKEAVVWYSKSAENGDASGMSALGGMYEAGRGVKKDLKEAVDWYRKAAALGNEDAKASLKRLGQ